MNSKPLRAELHEHLWRDANVRIIPSAILFVAGAAISSIYGDLRHGSLDRVLLGVAGVALFLVFSVNFLRVLTQTLYRLLAFYKFSTGRAAALVFVIRLFGYGAILITTLGLLGIPVGNLLLGGAALGIILGVAAQQALGNFFASIVIIISHPYSVGEHVEINSGALGGKYIGKIKDIGLTHTKIVAEDGAIVLLPNSTLLSSAAIITTKASADSVSTAIRN